MIDYTLFKTLIEISNYKPILNVIYQINRISFQSSLKYPKCPSSSSSPPTTTSYWRTSQDPDNWLLWIHCFSNLKLTAMLFKSSTNHDDLTSTSFGFHFQPFSFHWTYLPSSFVFPYFPNTGHYNTTISNLPWS